MQTEMLNQRFAQEYLETLLYRDIPHEKVHIIFSGVPGSGKTTLARKLARDLQAQYIRHDDIRGLIRRDGFNVADFTIAKISSIVMDTVMRSDVNKRIVVDASLDRSWPRFFEHAREHHARPIVIRLNVGRMVAEERINARMSESAGTIAKLNMFYEQFENCKKHVSADVELGESYDYEDVLRRVETLLNS